MIKCNSCNKIIKNKEDINFLAFLGFVPRPFCNNCYSSKERGFERHFLYTPKAPINSKIYFLGLMLLTIIMMPLWIVIALFSDTPMWGRLLMIIMIIMILGTSWTLRVIVNKRISEIK